MPGLILFDVDGTLVDEAGVPYPRATELVNTCALTMQVALCSARPYCSLLRLCCEFFPNVSHLGASQGALISTKGRSSSEWRIIRENPLTDSEVETVLRISRSFRADALFHGKYNWFVTQMSAAAESESAILGVAPHIVQMGETLPETYKIACIVEDSCERNALLERLVKNGLNAAQSKPNYVEIIARTASTSKGASELQCFLEVSSERTISVGDAANDLGLLARANIAVTFDKAPLSLKAVASDVLPNPEFNGLPTLLELILKKHLGGDNV